MKNEEKKNENNEIVDNVLKLEVNLMNYPFFLIDNKKNKINKIELKTTVNRIGTKTEIYWHVYSNSEYGLPSQFDKEVYMVIQEILESIPKPVTNPIPIGSIYSLIKKLCISNTTNNYKNVKKALERISVTRIKSVGAFYSKDKKVWIEDLFGIFDRIVWKGEIKVDGSIAEQNYIYLGSKFLENINSNYVKPIDRAYYKKELRFPISKRLYELLGVKFYAIFQNKNAPNYIRFSYDNLCDIIPMTNYIYVSKIKQKLEPSLKNLQNTGFLSNYKIEKENDRIFVYFYPGSRAIDEFKKFNSKLPNENKYEIVDDSTYDLPARNNPNQNVLLSSNETNPSQEDKDASELVSYFYQKLTGNNGRVPSQREIIQARKLIDEFGKDVAKYIVDYAFEEAPKTKFNMKTFGAVLQYAHDAANSYQEYIEEEKRRKKAAQEALIKQQIAQQAKKIRESISDEEYEAAEKEAFRRAFQKHPNFVNLDGTPSHELGIFVYNGGELDQVIVDWYIDRIKDNNPS
jgi:hypothetical protein